MYLWSSKPQKDTSSSMYCHVLYSSVLNYRLTQYYDYLEIIVEMIGLPGDMGWVSFSDDFSMVLEHTYNYKTR